MSLENNYLEPRFKSNWKILTGHQEWLVEYAKGSKTYPICIEIDPSNICPLNCENCCWGKMRSERKGSIPEEKLISLVKDVSSIGTKSIIWTGGGDPLANPATPKAVVTASELGIENAMFTNGVLLTSEKSDILCNNLNWIRFNMAGDCPESYSRVHRVPEKFYQTVCKNIIYFCKHAKESVDTGIGTAINQHNFDGLKRLPFLAMDLGVDFFQAKLDFNEIGSPEYVQWWNEVVVPHFLSVKSELGGKVRVFSDPIVRTTTVDYCHAHRIITAITADGRVSFCKMRRDQESTTLGNICSETLEEIFDGDKHKLLSGNIHPSTCPILRNFCPYRTTNEAVETFTKDQGYPIPKDAVFEDKHINFF